MLILDQIVPGRGEIRSLLDSSSAWLLAASVGSLGVCFMLGLVRVQLHAVRSRFVDSVHVAECLAAIACFVIAIVGSAHLFREWTARALAVVMVLWVFSAIAAMISFVTV